MGRAAPGCGGEGAYRRVSALRRRRTHLSRERLGAEPRRNELCADGARTRQGRDARDFGAGDGLRRRAGRKLHYGRPEVLQAWRRILALLPRRRSRRRLAGRRAREDAVRSVRGEDGDGAGEDEDQRSAPGRVGALRGRAPLRGKERIWRGLVRPLLRPRRLRSSP